MLLATWGKNAAAQQDIPGTPHLFLERTYFAPFNPLGKNLLFEGDAAAHYFLFNQFTWDWTRVGGWAFAMPLSMNFTVRMSTSPSSPVRTPSYRIRPIWLQAVHMTPETSDTRAFSLYGFGLGAMHYSNGQANCTYLGFERDTTPDHECVVKLPSLAVLHEPNTVDGDFSTTFFPFAFDARWGRLEDASYHVKRQHTVALEFHLTPLGMQPGGLDRAQALEYGRHQFNARYEFEQHTTSLGSGLHRLALSGVFRTRQDSGKTWSTAAAEYSRVYEHVQGFGWFVRAHLGGDYYNIHFKETSRPLITFGLMWDQNRIDVYNRTGHPVPGGHGNVADQFLIASATTRYASLLAGASPDAIADAFMDDALLEAPPSPALLGRKSIRDYFAATLARGKTTSVAMTIDTLSVSRSSAMSAGPYRQVVAVSPGVERTVTGTYAAVWRKEGAEWHFASLLMHPDH